MDAILIAGPTASGKSGLAMALALEHDGVVVNADSMQVYDALPILTARPGAADMATVDHRLYGHVSVETAYSTGAWYRDAARVLADVRASGRLPIVVGGTGLYFRALTGGLAPMPDIPDAVRDHWRARLSAEGAAGLHAELQRRDPATARRLDPTDGQRIVRALEVIDATGSSIGVFQERAGEPLIDPACAVKLLVMPERALLRRRIAERFEAMLHAGALAEVQALLRRRLDPDLPAMRAIGVRELQGALEGKFKVVEAAERAVTASRQYAKRQMTWFRNQLDESWRVLADAEIFASERKSDRHIKDTLTSAR